MNCTGSPRSREMSAIIPGVSSACRESFSISVVSRAELSGCAPWTSTFADQRKDYRYYEILDDTLRGNFEHRYFAIVDNNGHVRAIQPFFLVDQDILEGLGAERIHWISLVRRFYPRFLKLRALMVGCSAGEAHLAATDTLPADIIAETLSKGIVKQARSLNAQLIVLKEFPSRYRKALHCFVQCGLSRTRRSCGRATSASASTRAGTGKRCRRAWPRSSTSSGTGSSFAARRCRSTRRTVIRI